MFHCQFLCSQSVSFRFSIDSERLEFFNSLLQIHTYSLKVDSRGFSFIFIAPVGSFVAELVPWTANLFRVLCIHMAYGNRIMARVVSGSVVDRRDTYALRSLTWEPMNFFSSKSDALRGCQHTNRPTVGGRISSALFPTQ